VEREGERERGRLTTMFDVDVMVVVGYRIYCFSYYVYSFYLPIDGIVYVRLVQALVQPVVRECDTFRPGRIDRPRRKPAP
jgi:hypothetical protein